jgi:hypothetical protein
MYICIDKYVYIYNIVKKTRLKCNASDANHYSLSISKLKLSNVEDHNVVLTQVIKHLEKLLQTEGKYLHMLLFMYV